MARRNGLAWGTRNSHSVQRAPEYCVPAGCGHAGTRVAVASFGAWRLDQPARGHVAMRMLALPPARCRLAPHARRRAQGVLEETRDDAVIRTMRADSELPNVVGEMAFFLGIPQPRSWQVRPHP